MKTQATPGAGANDDLFWKLSAAYLATGGACWLLGGGVGPLVAAGIAIRLLRPILCGAPQSTPDSHHGGGRRA